MANNQATEATLLSPPLLRDIVTMPWDLDRFHGKNAKLQRKITCSRLETRPSRLFTIPLDILENLLDRLTRRDAFQLSRTCKTLISHLSVLKAIFCESISLPDLQNWYRHLHSSGLKTNKMMGPPVTWGISTLTGPLVRRMAIPEWASLQDLKYLILHCPNLHAIDLTEIFETGPKDALLYSDEVLYSESGTDSGSDSVLDSDDNGIRSIDWEKLINLLGLTKQPQLPHILYKWRQNGFVELFKNLRSIHLPYGCWKTVWSRHSGYKKSRSVCLPPLLRLASHLESLELSCQQEPNRRPSPKTRRKTSKRLLAEILDNVSRELRTIALYQSESTINNLDIFSDSLAVFPKLRTIKHTLHRDLKMYQSRTQRLYGLDNITAPILSRSVNDYEHDTASVLQYLSIMKKINDRGRMSLVSSDSGENYHSTPHDYYGLCHTEIVHRSSDSLWTPVWTWEDYLSSVESRQDHSVNTLDIEQCRSLFEELTKARYPVSLELEPLNDSRGAFFAPLMDQSTLHRRYDGSDDVGNILNGYFQTAVDSRLTTPVPDVEQRATQRFIQRSVLTPITSKNPSPYYGIATGADYQSPITMPLDFAAFGDKLSYGDYKDGDDFHPLALAAWFSPKEETPQEKRRGDPGTSNEKPHVVSVSTDPENDIPHPIWQLNEVGDLVDDLRLTWHETFACLYAVVFAEHSDPNPDWSQWAKTIHTCKMHLRARLWRESEQTALLFRRIKIDFPRLTRFALYIPAALYPDHDQTFITHVLPGTGWTVKHYGAGGMRRSGDFDESCVKLASDLCPFVRRIFSRSRPTDDPDEVAVLDEEWCVTKRPLFDLDGEYKTMQQLLTERLEENYTREDDGGGL